MNIREEEEEEEEGGTNYFEASTNSCWSLAILLSVKQLSDYLYIMNFNP